VQLHIAVLLFGLAGLFGKFLHLSSIEIVFGRAAFAAFALWPVVMVLRKRRRVTDWSRILAIALAGVVLAFHWGSFFYAIQVSTVAIGLLTFASFPAFVTLLEPWVFGERWRGIDLVTALLVIVGLFVIVPRFHLTDQITRGALWGICSGILFAILSLLNRRLVRNQSALSLAGMENLVAAIVLLPFLKHYGTWPTVSQVLLLAVLGIICTAIAHALFIMSLSRLRAQPASIAATLEPLYGIILAAIFLGEIPTRRTAIGGAIIIAAVIVSGTRRAGRK